MQTFPASFTLSGANSTTTSEIIRTYAGGTINIRETALAGWKLTSLSCTASDGNLSGVTASPTTGVTLTNLPTGSTNRLITCTFANTRDNPQMVVEKTVSPSTISAPGPLNYTISLRNTGNVPLTGIALTDTVTQQGTTLATPAPAYVSGDSNGNGAVDPGEAWVYRVTYAATQANVDNGNPIQNSVSVRTAEIATPQIATATTAISANPSMSITKTATPATVNTAGQVVTYAISLANLGNVTLDGIALTDRITQGAATRATPTPSRVSGDANANNRLDVGETWGYSASYTVTQADINTGGNLLNTVGVTSTTPGATAQNATATTAISATPAYSVTKITGTPSVSAPGPVSFTITVKNEGNVTLTGISLADKLTLGNGSQVALTPVLSAGDANANGALDLAETWTYTASYTVTQADLDDGRSLSNAVSVTTAQTTTPHVDTAIVSMVRQPAYALTKTVDQASIAAPGTLNYQILIANAGNVALTNLSINDQIQRGNGVPVPPTTGPVLTGGDTNANDVLDVGETWTYAATYAVTQAAITSGQPITNRVETGFSQIAERRFSTATTLIKQAPGMVVTKTVDLTSITAPGPLNYLITVRNAGNTDLTGLVFADTMTQGGTALTAAPTPIVKTNGNGNAILEVDEVWTFEAQFVVDQGHIDNGGRLEAEIRVGRRRIGGFDDADGVDRRHPGIDAKAGRRPFGHVIIHRPLPGRFGRAGAACQRRDTADIQRIGIAVRGDEGRRFVRILGRQRDPVIAIGDLRAIGAVAGIRGVVLADRIGQRRAAHDGQKQIRRQHRPRRRSTRADIDRIVEIGDRGNGDILPRGKGAGLRWRDLDAAS